MKLFNDNLSVWSMARKHPPRGLLHFIINNGEVFMQTVDKNELIARFNSNTEAEEMIIKAGWRKENDSFVL